MQEWDWKLAMSRLVIRSITLTGRVTNVMCSKFRAGPLNHLIKNVANRNNEADTTNTFK